MKSIETFQHNASSPVLNESQIINDVQMLTKELTSAEFEHEIIWSISVNYALIPILNIQLKSIQNLISKLPFLDSLLIYHLYKNNILSKEQIIEKNIVFEFEKLEKIDNNENETSSVNNLNENEILNEEEAFFIEEEQIYEPKQVLVEFEDNYDNEQKVHFAGKLAVIIALDKVDILEQLFTLPTFNVDIPIHCDDQQYLVWEMSMLDFAAQQNANKCFRFLLEHGADPKVESKSLIKWNAMAFAASVGNMDMINILINDYKMKIEPQVGAAAAKFRQNQILKWFVDQRCDLSQALLTAAEWNNIEGVKICLKNEANPNAVDSMISFFYMVIQLFIKNTSSYCSSKSSYEHFFISHSFRC